MVLKHIAEGWFNDFLKDMNLLDENIKNLGERRMAVCSSCPVRTENRCDNNKSHKNIDGITFNGCGCRIDKKTLCVECNCPGRFW
jgi:hypothetical protein